MRRKVDLHTHSTASDGIYTPKELIDIALEEGIVAIGITDHDTIDGLDEAIEYSNDKDIKIIPGIEFSIDYSGGTFHLLGYYIDYNNKALVDECKRLTKIRESRAEKIIADLKKKGIDIPLNEVIDQSTDGSIGRPHIARILLKYGYAESFEDVFQNYMIKGKPGYIKKEKISIDSAISLIKKAGGIPVLAHPITLKFNDFIHFEELLKSFVSKGITGIEAYSSMHSEDDIVNFTGLAEKYNLIITGGSDFHGDKKEEIGHYSINKKIPLDTFYMLEEAILKIINSG